MLVEQVIGEFIMEQAKQIAKDLEVDVPDIRLGMLSPLCNGQFCPDDNSIILNKYNINWLTDNELINLLAHEIRHYWQYRTGLLKADSDIGQLIWNNTIYTMELGCMIALEHLSSEDRIAIHYQDFPWEIDARNYASDYVNRSRFDQGWWYKETI
jgi:hypothetical protein